MAERRLHIQRVAIIGAGVSGVGAAIHLKRAGLDVIVYERSAHAGGIWVHDERSAREAAYPSTLPSAGDSPEYDERLPRKSGPREDSPLRESDPETFKKLSSEEDVALSFAPPGPCYVSLKNNVSTTEMQMSCQEWKPGTEDFVPHYVLGEYIQDLARNNGVLPNISFNSRVDVAEKVGPQWRLDLSFLSADKSITPSTELFDGVVVAVGNYHACNIPDIPGLAAWKKRFPDRIQHSKLYRKPDSFKDQNVLLIGAGVSSVDIARDIGGIARSVYQSSRGGMYDVPAHLLPENAARVEGIASFDALEEPTLTTESALPGTITLTSGRKLCNIHRVVVCTGYHVSFPFMRGYHADGVRPEDADSQVLVTDGQQTHNLHKDIWYIPDPTLTFIGVPYHTANFSLFEFQSMALAQVFAGIVALPSEEAMREEYAERLEKKGAGRTFHSLKGDQGEVNYVKELNDMVTRGGGSMTGHTQRFLDAYARRQARLGALFSQQRDPALNENVLGLLSCT